MMLHFQETFKACSEVWTLKQSVLQKERDVTLQKAMVTHINNLKFKYSKLLLFLPAYLLLGFPKTFLTPPILLPPFQHISELLLIVASLPAMIGFDTLEIAVRPLIWQVNWAIKYVHSGPSLISPVPSCDLLLHWFSRGKSFLYMSVNCILLENLLVLLNLPNDIAHAPWQFLFYTVSFANRKEPTSRVCFLNLPHISLFFPSLNFLLLSYYQSVRATLQFYSLAHQLLSSAVRFPQSVFWLDFLHYFAPLVQHFFHWQEQQQSRENKLCHV